MKGDVSGYRAEAALLHASRTLARMLRPRHPAATPASGLDDEQRRGERHRGADASLGRRTARPANPLVWGTLLTYLTLVGGTPSGDVNGWVRPVNAAIALGLILFWARGLSRDHDWMDRTILVAVLIFLVSSLGSLFPRQSFDAAVQVVAVAAALWIARRHLARRLRRPDIEKGMGWLGVGISAVVFIMWTLAMFQWAAASGWRAFPPLNLPLPTASFGHPHDVAILVCLLVPAAWSPSFRKRWRVAAWIATILTAIIIVLDGSRNVQVAVGLATGLFLLGRTHPRRIRWRDQRWRIAAASATLAVLVLAAPPILSRLANFTTVGSRFGIWADSVSVWLQHPVSGIGPGAFPFAFLLGDHFTRSAFDPRHPDNAVIQVVVEAGLLGLVAMAIVVAGVLTAAVRTWRREPRAAWALTVFAFACVGANPSDFVFLLAPTIVWVAVLTPPGRLARSEGRAALRTWPLRGLRYGLVAVITVAMILTSSAAILYERARDAFARGDFHGSITALEAAASFDPSQSIYWREMASVELATGNLIHAEADYRQAISLDSYDPIALRGLALTLAARGSMDAARAAADLAAERNRLSAQNQIPLAVIAARMGDTDASNAALARTIASEPHLAAAPWMSTILRSIDVQSAVQMTLESDDAKVGIGTFEGVVLMAIGLFVPGTDIAAIGGDIPAVLEGTAEALRALAECDFQRAWNVLLAAESAEREYAGYWLARALVASAMDGDSQVNSEIPGTRPTGDSLLGEQGDLWRYRRVPIAPITPETSMPSRSAGWSRLITEPELVAASLGGTWPPRCPE